MVKNMRKIIYILLSILLIAGAVYYYTFVYAKNHHRDAQSETAIIISAEALTAAYQNNEQAANKLYLNKAVEVSGNILTINKDQAGHTTLLIGIRDAFSNVSVTLNSAEAIAKKVGDPATVKGVCTGYLSDVIINEGVLK
jgi:hypothetical protein